MPVALVAFFEFQVQEGLLAPQPDYVSYVTNEAFAFNVSNTKVRIWTGSPHKSYLYQNLYCKTYPEVNTMTSDMTAVLVGWLDNKNRRNTLPAGSQRGLTNIRCNPSTTQGWRFRLGIQAVASEAYPTQSNGRPWTELMLKSEMFEVHNIRSMNDRAPEILAGLDEDVKRLKGVGRRAVEDLQKEGILQVRLLAAA